MWDGGRGASTSRSTGSLSSGFWLLADLSRSGVHSAAQASHQGHQQDALDAYAHALPDIALMHELVSRAQSAAEIAWELSGDDVDGSCLAVVEAENTLSVSASPDCLAGTDLRIDGAMFFAMDHQGARFEFDGFSVQYSELWPSPEGGARALSWWADGAAPLALLQGDRAAQARDNYGDPGCTEVQLGDGDWERVCD